MLDRIDRKILAELQKDATLPVAQLGERVGLSSTPCWKRIKRLEEEGLLTGRVALVDRKKVGLPVTVFVSLRLARHDEASLQRLAALVADMPEVQEFHRMSGDVDYLLKVVSTSIEGYDQFYKKLIAVSDFRSVSSAFSMEQIKSSTALPLDLV
ncbi:Lrp/AsnC family transcriptional regulator [Kinneretia asaccharophila]|uniref:AsnC family transcriptional regulator n=1 Tax=Roseateles asaccharophilus TaxID=582607 RepID=A0A4R6MYX0_9BURK|nr:Lrp/AsnC family transcriptional regulator [Roseateles asaccharophilus]MDN3545483.1 Lrp/AsnC family transcriptional regulator [Roseateles asaccharophilus]TDP07863.1 AsnC family transcriptional regulator [Roseateles asaccharophilus]